MRVVLKLLLSHTFLKFVWSFLKVWSQNEFITVENVEIIRLILYPALL